MILTDYISYIDYFIIFYINYHKIFYIIKFKKIKYIQTFCGYYYAFCDSPKGDWDGIS